MRILSLVPSATEMICFLGLEDQLVGVSHACDYPERVKTIPKVTRSRIPAMASSREIDQLVRDQWSPSSSLYSLDVSTVESLHPDLIVTQSLCSICAVAEADVSAVARKLPGNPAIVNLQPHSLREVFDAIRQLALATGNLAKGDLVIRELEERVDAITSLTSRISKRPRVAFLEWLEPPFSSGHWNPELVRLAGGIDGLGREGQPSRTLTWSEVIRWQPEVIVVACCGFGIERTLEDVPLLEAVPGYLELPAVRANRVYVSDGSQFFNRPGPRLVDSLEILAHALNPERFAIPGHLKEQAVFHLRH